MTAEELIKQLEKYPKEWPVEVQISSDGAEANHVFNSGFDEVIISD